MQTLILRIGPCRIALPVLETLRIIPDTPAVPVPGAPSDQLGVLHYGEEGTVVPLVDGWRLVGCPEDTGNRERAIVLFVEVYANVRERCFHHLNCTTDACPAYGEDRDPRCWLVSGTHCRRQIQGSYREKIDACRTCPYYIMMQKDCRQVVAVRVDAVEGIRQGEMIQDGAARGDAGSRSTAGLAVLGYQRHDDEPVPVLDTQTLLARFVE